MLGFSAQAGFAFGRKTRSRTIRIYIVEVARYDWQESAMRILGAQNSSGYADILGRVPIQLSTKVKSRPGRNSVSAFARGDVGTSNLVP